jgi:IS4 transposase
LPVFADLTKGKVHEINIARRLSFPKGSIVVIDRGYTDYELFGKWTEEGIYFVTRQKDNADYMVIQEKPLPKNRNILKDEIIRLNGYYASKECPCLLSPKDPLERIEVWDEENEKIIALLTNHQTFGSTTISVIYKDKTIKQNLKIKTFVGTSPNAVMIQIWTALISILILKYLKFRSTFGWSLSNLVAMLRYNLFTYRDLWTWIDNPFEPLPSSFLWDGFNWTA